MAAGLHVAGSIPVSNALIEWGIIVNNIRRPPPHHTALAAANSNSLDQHDMVATAPGLKDIPMEVVILSHCNFNSGFRLTRL